MIDRYTLEPMGSIWTEKAKFNRWLQVEIAVAEAWEKLGQIPQGTTDKIKQKARFDIKRIREIESVRRHDVVAFVENVREYLGPEGEYIHFGVTSSDIIDTATAIALRESSNIIIDDMNRLMKTLKNRAFEFKDTLMIGRSHGVHGEPITFGFVLALWYDEMRRNLERIKNAQREVSCGKISGSMGTFANVPPEVEEIACRLLSLKPVSISNQVIQRDIYAQYLATLAITASSIEKIATQIRHYQRTEVREAEEYFHPGQKGSSSMPHKRNPVLSENLCGLARLVRSYAAASLENIALWHERDISHSSNERVTLPDSNILVDFMLNRLNEIISNLIVYRDNMLKNLNLLNGIIYSQRVMLTLIEKGMDKLKAYEITQKHAMNSLNSGREYKALLLGDEIIMNFATQEDIEGCFDPTYYVRRIDDIFKRVFG